MKTTNNITYIYKVEGHEIAITRILGIRYTNNPIHHHYENVRNFNIVRDEMKANYERKETR